MEISLLKSFSFVMGVDLCKMIRYNANRSRQIRKSSFVDDTDKNVPLSALKKKCSYSPRSGGNGGSLGSRMRVTSLPPTTAQIKRTVMPNRFPFGRHSSPVMDQTTPKSTAARRTKETEKMAT